MATALVAQAAGAGSSVPQMNPVWYPNQLFWLAVSFGLLYMVVARFITPNVRRVLATREHAINNAIREAERAKQSAEQMRSSFESQGHQARASASESLAKAQTQLTKDAAEAMAKLDHDLARKAALADTRITGAREKALATMQEATTNLASAMAEKLLGHAVPEEQVEQIVTDLMKA